MFAKTSDLTKTAVPVPTDDLSRLCGVPAEIVTALLACGRVGTSVSIACSSEE